MIQVLINLGLVLTPFLIQKGIDIRVPKEVFGLGIALAVGLYALYSGSLKKFKNYWLLIFIAYFIFCICQSPYFTNFILANREGNAIDLLMKRNMSGFWVFKPFLVILVYSIMLITVASINFKEKWLRVTLNIMAGCGFLMSLYIFIQAVQLDQFFNLIPEEIYPDVPHMTKPRLGGFIGQPTVVAPFIAMVIPIALYLGRWRYLWAGSMITAVYMTESKMAIGAMCVSCVAYLVFSERKWHKWIACVLILISLFIFIFKYQDYMDKKFGGQDISITYKMKWKEAYLVKEWICEQASGRCTEWGYIWDDITSPPEKKNEKPYAVTGFGLGAFEYTYSVRKDSRFQNAHSEPLEALYNFGIIGVSILYMFLFFMVRNVFRMITVFADYELILSLGMSLVCVFLCSLGTFPFHIAPTAFYTVVIIGLIHNEGILGGKYNDS